MADSQSAAPVFRAFALLCVAFFVILHRFSAVSCRSIVDTRRARKRRVLGKPLKKQDYDKRKKEYCERAVPVFQRAFLRLPDYGKRA